MSNLNELLEIMKDHAEHDRLIQGTWLSAEKIDGAFRGCFYGCAMQTEEDPIEKACEKYGLPIWFGHWSEKVFENLSVGLAMRWPVELLQALIDFKGDTEQLLHDLAVKRLSSLLLTGEEDVDGAIKQAIAYHKDPSEEKRQAVNLTARAVVDSEALRLVNHSMDRLELARVVSARLAVVSAEWSTEWSIERLSRSAKKPICLTYSVAGSAEAAADSVRLMAEATESKQPSVEPAWRNERKWMLELLRSNV